MYKYYKKNRIYKNKLTRKTTFLIFSARHNEQNGLETANHKLWTLNTLKTISYKLQP